jgi:hypothetical protein
LHQSFTLEPVLQWFTTWFSFAVSRQTLEFVMRGFASNKRVLAAGSLVLAAGLLAPAGPAQASPTLLPWVGASEAIDPDPLADTAVAMGFSDPTAARRCYLPGDGYIALYINNQWVSYNWLDNR